MLRRGKIADDRVELDKVTVRYGRRVALEGLSGTFEPGSLTAVVGPNGAGKSTLLAAIADVIRPAQGRIDRPPAKQLLARVQQAVFAAQAHGHAVLRPDCASCGGMCRVKDQRLIGSRRCSAR